ncbi:hypothetical protein QP558_23640, partial [Escherichia coli]|nr:hypothetical protein [Escherichia coli]
WKPPAHSPEENMVRQKCSGIRRSYLDMRMEEKHFTGTLAWCENISVQKNRKVIRKDCRENSLFTIPTIDEAIAIMTKSGNSH